MADPIIISSEHKSQGEVDREINQAKDAAYNEALNLLAAKTLDLKKFEAVFTREYVIESEAAPQEHVETNYQAPHSPYDSTKQDDQKSRSQPARCIDNSHQKIRLLISAIENNHSEAVEFLLTQVTFGASYLHKNSTLEVLKALNESAPQDVIHSVLTQVITDAAVQYQKQKGKQLIHRNTETAPFLENKELLEEKINLIQDETKKAELEKLLKDKSSKLFSSVSTPTAAVAHARTESNEDNVAPQVVVPSRPSQPAVKAEKKRVALAADVVEPISPWWRLSGTNKKLIQQRVRAAIAGFPFGASGFQNTQLIPSLRQKIQEAVQSVVEGNEETAVIITDQSGKKKPVRGAWNESEETRKKLIEKIADQQMERIFKEEIAKAMQYTVKRFSFDDEGVTPEKINELQKKLIDAVAPVVAAFATNKTADEQKALVTELVDMQLERVAKVEAEKAALKTIESYNFNNRVLTLLQAATGSVKTVLLHFKNAGVAVAAHAEGNATEEARNIVASRSVVQAAQKRIIQNGIAAHGEIPSKEAVESQDPVLCSNEGYDAAVNECLCENQKGYARMTEITNRVRGKSYQIEFLAPNTNLGAQEPKGNIDGFLSFASDVEKNAIRDFLLNPPCETVKDLQVRVAEYKVYQYDSRDFHIPNPAQEDIAHAAKLLKVKKAEVLAVEAYNNALSTNPKPNNISELYFKAALAKLEYRKMVYEDRAQIELDVSPYSAKKKLKATVELIECVKAMLPPAAQAIEVVGAVQPQAKPIRFPDSSAACDGTLGKLRSELLKHTFGRLYEEDVKHCKTDADLKKLSDAALKLKKAISENEIKTTSGSDVEKINARIAILQAKLEYRKALYEIRFDNKEAYTGLTFFRSAHTSAKAKLMDVTELLTGLQNLKSYHESDVKPAAPVTVGKAAAEGELGKLYKELIEVVKLVKKEKSEAPALSDEPERRR